MANSGTLISTISMTSARNAMAVDDCIGRLAPSNDHRGRLPSIHCSRSFWVYPRGRRIISEAAQSDNGNSEAI